MPFMRKEHGEKEKMNAKLRRELQNSVIKTEQHWDAAGLNRSIASYHFLHLSSSDKLSKAKREKTIRDFSGLTSRVISLLH